MVDALDSTKIDFIPQILEIVFFTARRKATRFAA